MVHLVPQQQPWAAEKCVEYKAWHHPMLLHPDPEEPGSGVKESWPSTTSGEGDGPSR